jgi:hypothetical protein
MQRRSFLTALVACTTFAGPAGAQSFLDKAKSALGGAGLPGVSGGGSGASSGGGLGSALSTGEISGGLKDALRIATDRTVSTVGKTDGYYGDPAIKIPLPGSLKLVQQGLSMAGYGSLTDDLQLKINRAAEAAAPQAKDVFVESIQQMSLDDARGILNGPDDAATQYFKKTMSNPLKDRMRPIVSDQLSQVGAVKSLDAVMGQAASVPGVPTPTSSLTDFTLDGALSGIFHYLAAEEKAIRQNPAARSTELLKKVFG